MSRPSFIIIASKQPHKPDKVIYEVSSELRATRLPRQTSESKFFIYSRSINRILHKLQLLAFQYDYNPTLAITYVQVFSHVELDPRDPIALTYNRICNINRAVQILFRD